MWTRTWARGNPRIQTTYAYNNAGDLETVTYNDGTPSITCTYDRRGRQATVARNGITTTQTYNDPSLPIGESYSGGTLTGLYVTNIYDNYLRRTQSASKTTGGGTLSTASYGYDNASWLQSVSDGVNSATYSYVANSPLVSQITFNNGANRMTTSKQYDKLNRLTSILSTPSGTNQLPVSFAYAYNAANQRYRVTLNDGSYWFYEYDTLGQLRSGKKYWSDGTPVAGQQFEYTHDDIGNRTQTKAGGDASGAGLRPATYTANSLNQYSSREVPNAVDVLGIANGASTVTVNSQATYRRGEYYHKALTIDNSAAPQYPDVTVSAVNGGSSSNLTGKVFLPKTPENFGYDLDGNLTNDGRWAFTWDAENRLIKLESLASGPSGSKRRLEFEYDWQGRRIKKKVTNLDTGSVLLDNKFLYERWNLVAELNATNNAVIRSYMWGLDLSGTPQGAGGVGGLLAVNDAANGVHFVAYDGNGNVAALVKAIDGTVSAQYEYGPFAEPIRVTGLMAKVNPLRFSTKYTDDESGFLYYGRRYYDPLTGRWLSQDPIGERGFDPVAANQTNLREVIIAKARLQLRLLLQNKQLPDLIRWPATLENGLSASNENVEDWLREESNLYAFVQNDPVDHIDALGELTIKYWCPSYRWCATCVITFQPSGKQLYYLAVNAQRFISCAARSAGIMNLGCALASRTIFNKGCDALAGCLQLYTRQIWPPPPPGRPPGFP